MKDTITIDDVTVIREAIDWSPRFITKIIEAEAVGSRYDLCMTWDRVQRRLMVALLNFQTSYLFNGTAHWDYVGEKLSLPRPGAQAVTAIINRHFDTLKERAWI